MTAFLDCFGERQQYCSPCADIYSKSYKAILKSYAQGDLLLGNKCAKIIDFLLIRGKQTFLTD